MPESITSNIFLESDKKDSQIKRRFSYLEKKPESTLASNSSNSSPSILTKLGRTFRIFRNPTSSLASIGQSFRGIFSDSDPKKSINSITNTATSAATQQSRVSKPVFARSSNTRHAGSMKRLIIKSKPMKFYLIDANKVISSKKRKVIPNVVSSDKLLSEKYYSSDDESDEEIDSSQKTFNRFPYNISSKEDGESSKSKPILGESVKSPEPKANNIINEEINGYWSTPTIQELSSMSLAQLAGIENFIIGRVGYGQVAYNYPVDLSQIATNAKSKNISFEEELFENTVSIRHKHVIAYHNDEANKPALGFGLNIPATITLEGVSPTESESAADFIRYLQQRKGMEYVTYDPITHVWIFKVKHFSIWGLVDDSEALLEMKRKQDIQEDQHDIEYSKLYSNESYLKEIKKQKIENETKDLPGGWNLNTNNNNNPLNIKRGLVAQEIESQIDQFNNSDAIALSKIVNDITIQDNYENASPLEEQESILDDISFDENENKLDYLKQLVSFLPRDVNFNEIVNEKVYEPEITNDAIFDSIQTKPNLPVSDDWLVQLELANDLNSSLTPFAAATENVGGKGGKISINAVDDFLFSDFNKSLIGKDQVSTPNNFSAKVKSIDTKLNLSVSSIVSILLAKSSVSTRSNTFPIIKKSSPIKISEFSNIDRSSPSESQLISLASALFDEQTGEYEKQVSKDDSELLAHASELSKKKVFGNWLKSFNSKAIKLLIEQNQNDPLELAFTYICAGEIKSAIQTALNSDNPHLSVILTLVDSNDENIQNIAASQIESWIESDSLELIPSSIVKIYQVIAGLLDEVVEELPWNIALAIKLFYGDSSLKLEEVIKEVYDSNLSGSKFGESTEVIDILQLFYQQQTEGKDKALETIRNSSLSKLLKWLFYDILSTDDSSSDFDELTYDLGNYLQEQGLWKDSLYVLAHLSNDVRAKDAIRNVIISNTGSIKGSNYDEEPYLVGTLKIPHTLIYEAIGIKNHSEKKYWEECEAYITAKLWDNAHDTIIKQLGPATVIANSDELKSRFLQVLTQFPQSGLIISDWNKGAGIYQNYFNIINNPNDITSLKFLLANIPVVKESSSFQTKCALKIISKKIGDLAIINASNIEDPERKVKALFLGSTERKYFDIRLQSICI
ncbi:nucleoporin NUP145 precursor [Scheffersomyces coipomensis]|uniref:nucleoporin NUP145 precursor n=1 Tax=Scheffersomyces coipomensis TaxID=1788519 RepID=UPI00315DC6B5